MVRLCAPCCSFQREKSCHIWTVGRMKLASLEARRGGGLGFVSLFHSSLSGKLPRITEILLTGILSLYSIDQTYINRFLFKEV